LIDYRRQQGNDAQAEAATDYQHMRVAMLALVLAAIVAGGVLAAMIAASVESARRRA
jgi:methyl-accepting chemotaxis protein